MVAVLRQTILMQRCQQCNVGRWQEDPDLEYTARKIHGAFAARDREFLMTGWQDEHRWDISVPDERREPWPGEGPDDPSWDARA